MQYWIRYISIWMMFCFGATFLDAQPLQDLTFQNIDFWPHVADGNYVWTVVADDQGFLWIASSAGLYRYNGTDWFRYLHSSDSTALYENNIRTVHKDRNGAIWAISFQGIFHRYNAIMDHFECLIPPTGHIEGVAYMLYESEAHPPGCFWIPAASGLYFYDTTQDSISLHKPITPPSDQYGRGYGFRGVLPDNQDPDLLWTGGLDGFYRYYISHDSFSYVPMPIMSEGNPVHYMLHDLFFVRDYLICGGSWAGGVLCYDVVADTWESFLYQPKRFTDWYNVVYSVLPLDSSIILVACNRRFGYFDLNTKEYIFYTWDDGRSGSIDSSWAYSRLYLTRQGNIVVSRDNGISISSSLTADSSKLYYPPLISGIITDDDHLDTDTVVHRLKHLELGPDRQDVTLTFVTPGNYAPEEVRIAYRLEGYDREWQITVGREARYTNLPDGLFTFQFRASIDGEHWVDGTPLLIERNVYLWQKAWFISALAFVVLAIAWVIYYFRIRSIRREEALKAEFNKRIAEVELQALRAQMNPHFMFNSLNAIKHYILTHDPLKASEYLTNFATLIRSILHNSREKLIPISREIEALMLYIELEQLRFDRKFEVHFSLSKEIDLEKVLIPPMILQPYVENAIWHGLMHKPEKGTLVIDLFRNNGILTCIIEDDGVGREVARILKSKSATRFKSMGMGITQDRIAIHNRMHAFGISVNVEDKLDQSGVASGTRVLINIPLNR